jgi:sulfite reductase (ferredoxin)
LVYLAANRSDSPRLAEAAGNISAHDVPEFIVRLLTAFQKVRTQYANLTAYLESEGKTEVKNLLSEYRDVPSFEEDKNYYFDWGAESVFSIVNRGAAECSAGLFDMIDLDLNYINTYKQALETETDPEKINKLLYDTVYSASRMLLVTRGAEPKTVEDTFDLFIRNFIGFGFVEEKFRSVVALAQKDRNADFISLKSEVAGLATSVIELYQNMDDSLQFKNIKPKAEKETKEDAPPKVNRKFKDLRGVSCPMNFVQTKIQLSSMKSDEELEILLDDGQPILNVPGSVRGEGHTILEQTQTGNHWKVVIKKK